MILSGGRLMLLLSSAGDKNIKICHQTFGISFLIHTRHIHTGLELGHLTG